MLPFNTRDSEYQPYSGLRYAREQTKSQSRLSNLFVSSWPPFSSPTSTILVEPVVKLIGTMADAAPLRQIHRLAGLANDNGNGKNDPNEHHVRNVIVLGGS